MSNNTVSENSRLRSVVTKRLIGLMATASADVLIDGAIAGGTASVDTPPPSGQANTSSTGSASNTDSAFLQGMRNDPDFNQVAPSEMINMAHIMCVGLAEGDSPQQLIAGASQSIPAGDAAYLLGASSAAYCPDELGKVAAAIPSLDISNTQSTPNSCHARLQLSKKPTPGSSRGMKEMRNFAVVRWSGKRALSAMAVGGVAAALWVGMSAAASSQSSPVNGGVTLADYTVPPNCSNGPVITDDDDWNFFNNLSCAEQGKLPDEEYMQNWTDQLNQEMQNEQNDMNQLIQHQEQGQE
jgi:hypothetical protein